MCCLCTCLCMCVKRIGLAQNRMNCNAQCVSFGCSCFRILLSFFLFFFYLNCEIGFLCLVTCFVFSCLSSWCVFFFSSFFFFCFYSYVGSKFQSILVALQRICLLRHIWFSSSDVWVRQCVNGFGVYRFLLIRTSDG